MGPTIKLSFSDSNPEAKATFSYGGSKPAYWIFGKPVKEFSNPIPKCWCIDQL